MSDDTKPSIAASLVPKGGRADVAATAIVVAIVIAMILPLPVWLLDVMLAINICASALLVVLVIQVKDTVELSAYPALLLITTLMRLALAVASTRLILLEGYAGHIIEAFGEIVVGGNLVVGFVIFLIVTLVQFMVITKGAERVAEVAARFTLDAMPGKQMAIDIELRAGSISADQAREQRAMLAQESQFFGAMDGAMKFVKGDAIAGIVIMLINLIGGLGVGVLQKGMSATHALHTYALLTVGDGLATQLPALLSSLTAGLLVTRGGADSRNIGRRLAEQLTSHPKAWVTASGVILALGLIPGMPLLVFGVIAAAFLGVGVRMTRSRLQEKATGHIPGILPDQREFELVSPLSFAISTRAAQHQDKIRLINEVRAIRNSTVLRYGMMLPPLGLEFEISGSNADLVLSQHDVPLLELTLPETAGIDSAWWQDYRQQMELHLLKAAPRAFGIQEAQRLMDLVATLYPQLHKELEKAVPISRFADVLQRLIAEQVSIRNLKIIIEALVEFAQRERDPVILVEQIRAALSREICSAYAVNGVLSTYMLEAELENAVRDAVRQTSYGSILVFDPGLASTILDNFDRLLQRDVPIRPIIVCAQDVRPYVRRIFADRFFLTPVLALAEASVGYRFEVIGILELHPRAEAEAPIAMGD